MSRNLRTWIKNIGEQLLSRGSGRSRRHLSDAAKRRPTARPTVETLEDRITPTNLVVGPGVGQYTLPAAVTQANADAGADSISFDPSLTASTISVTSPLQITANVTIDGSGAPGVMIDGGGITQIFNISGGVTASISNLTIQNGVAASGGGINNSGTLTLSNDAFNNNHVTGDGGGVSNGTSGATAINLGANLIASNCSFTGNSAGSTGGGLFNFGTLNLSSSMFTSNTATWGAGIGNGGNPLSGVGQATLTGCTMTLNIATASNSGGGGVNTIGGTVTLSNSTISNNAAYSGGGATNNGGTLNLINDNITDNTATNGGAVATANYFGYLGNVATTTVTNCTITGNVASGLGGGIEDGADYGGFSPYYSTTNVSGGTISGNTAASGGGIYNSVTITATNLTVFGNTATVSGAGILNTGTLTLSSSVNISGNTGGIDIENAGGILNAGDANAFNNSTNIHNNGTIDLAGSSPTMGALTGNGTITNNLTTYTIDNNNLSFGFNNTIGTETSGDQAEDGWVGNVFTSATGGTQLQSTSFYFGAQLNADLSGLPDQNVTAALYTGAPGGALTLVPGSVNTVTLPGGGAQWITIPFASLQDIPAGDVFTAAVLIKDIPSNIYPFSEDSSGSSANSYYDIDNPVGNVNTYNLAAPNNPTPNGVTYPGQPAGATNAFVDTTMLRVNLTTPAATLTVAGGGFFTGTIQDGSGTVGLTVAGASQNLTLTGNDTYTGATTINATDTLQAGSTTALSASSNVLNNGILNLGGYSNSIGALTGNGTVTNDLHTYTIDDFTTNGISAEFNNTLINEPEDNWVGNVFTAAPGGTQLQSVSFFTNYSALDAANYPSLPAIQVALYTGAPGAALTLVPGSVNSIPMNNQFGWVTVPFASLQNIPAGSQFTAAILIDDVPITFPQNSDGSFPNPTGFPFSQDFSGNSNNSYFDVDNPIGAVNTYNLAAPNDPTPNGSIYGSSGSTNANPDVTVLRTNFDTPTATLTVTGGGAFSGALTDGSANGADPNANPQIVAGGGILNLTVGGTSQTLTLSGTNPFSGDTVVTNTDTLIVNGTDANSPVTVAGTLGGTGTVGAVTTAGGVVSPGSPVSSTGTLTAASADLNLNVNITNGSNDELVAVGAVTLGGASTLNLDLTGLTSTTGPLTIVSASSVTGTFDAINISNNTTGYPVVVSYTGNSVIVTVANPTTVWVNDNWVDPLNPGDPQPGDVVTAPAGETAPNSANIALVFGDNAFATIQGGVNASQNGGTVYVLAGSYFESVDINKALTVDGANLGVNPNSTPRSAESVIMPSSVGVENDNGGVNLVAIDAANVTVDGFTIDGDNPALVGGVSYRGASIDASNGILSADGFGNSAIQNNIVQNIYYQGINLDTPGGTPVNGNSVTDNLVQNLGGGPYGFGISLADNYYATITGNSTLVVRDGISVQNMYSANPAGGTDVVSGNTISAVKRGIFYNNNYGSASAFAFNNNTVSAVAPTGDDAAESYWIGIALDSVQDSNTVTTTDNNVDGTADAATALATSDINVWNDPSPNVTVTGGTLTGAQYGIWVNTAEGFGPGAVNTQVTLGAGITATGATIDGLYIEDSPATNTANATATLTGVDSFGSTLVYAQAGSPAQAILQGTGDVGGTLTSTGGTVSPGTGPGMITSGNLSLDSNSTYLVDIQSPGATAGTDYDQINVTGTISLGNAILTVNPTYLPAAGTVFTIIKNNSGGLVSGTFAGLAEGATYTAPDGEVFTVSYNGNGEHDVTLTKLAPTITSVVINQDISALYNAAGQPSPGTQRSMVDDIVYTFSEPVYIDPTFTNVFTVALVTPGTVPTVSWAPVAGTAIAPNKSNEWAVSFSGAGTSGGSIANGTYDITIDPTKVAAVTDGQQLSVSGGLAPAPNNPGYATQAFFRLFGDINGDEVVNNADNVRFKQALSTYNAAFDFNADNTVNNADNVRFKLSLSIAFTGFSPTI